MFFNQHRKHGYRSIRRVIGVGIGISGVLLTTGCPKPAPPWELHIPDTSTRVPSLPPGVPSAPPTRIQHPEASMYPVKILHTGQGLSLIPQGGMEYLSEGGSGGGGRHADIDPIDRISQHLFDQKYKCLSTMHVLWSGTQAIIEHKTFGDKRAVIECRGDCREIRYRVGARALLPVTIEHFGLSQPLPMLHLRGPSVGGYTVLWTFLRPNSVGAEPKMFVHEWSNGFGDYGRGCQFDH